MADGPQFDEFAEPFAHHHGFGRIEKGEFRDVAEAQVEHRQDDARQRRAQHLGRRVGLAPGEVLFRIEAQADAGTQAAAASRTLARRRLRNGFDLEALHLRAMDVAWDAGQPRIDYVADAGYGHGSLRHVGGKDDSSLGREMKCPLLFAGGKRGEKRDDLVVGLYAREVVRRFPDVAFARQEHEHVAIGRQLAHGGGDFARQIALFVFGRRTVADFHGKQAPRNDDGGRVVEEGGKAVRVERGRRNDHLEFASAREYALEDAQKEIHVQRTLVGFIDDDGVVGAQKRIVARLGEQDAVGHERDACFI